MFVITTAVISYETGKIEKGFLIKPETKFDENVTTDKATAHQFADRSEAIKLAKKAQAYSRKCDLGYIVGIDAV